MFNIKTKIALGGDAVIELDVLKGALGQDVIDIRSFGSRDVFTFDPGFTPTASCESKITFIDSDEGILLHRGSPIDQLATESNYLEICYILLYDEKPTQAEYDEFRTTVTRHTMTHEQITRLFHAFRHDSHPMAVMCEITGTLTAFYHDSLDVSNPRHREVAAHRLLSRMPTMAAMCYRYSIGQPFVYPRNDLSYASNFLHVVFATPYEEYEINPIFKRAIDRIPILHADHEQNASTSTIRTAGSSGTNPFACIAAGIASPWGPAHGGVNEAALEVLEEISSVEHIPEFVRRAKGKNGSFRLMDFGHRVYKNYDPRATMIHETCHEVLKKLDTGDDLLQAAMGLEHITLDDPYFIEEKLYPNVDFCSGIILKAMDIPSSMFTVIFAMVHTVSRIAHWNEVHNDGMKIVRPRQLYTGYTKRDYQPDIKR